MYGKFETWGDKTTSGGFKLKKIGKLILIL